jgi:anti-sigma regulatory factor (Ser/Thr protein kinase)
VTDDAAREIRAHLPGDLVHMAQVCQRVAGFLEANSVPPRAAYAVQLVLEELITNIISYAHDDCAVHNIGVRVALEPEHALVEVEDDGRPFDPSTVPDADVRGPIQDRSIGGLGLHLVRQMSNGMDYSRAGGKNRLQVRIPV